MKTLQTLHRSTDSHWVGDGFPVSSIFTYREFEQEISPFLLLDYVAPTYFEPTTHQRGVGWHPHRGFETVTLVYDGEVSHRDTGGNSGTISQGDVQWMTAGLGVLHEEMHSEAYAKHGGPFEMIQLWVNLPARHKLTQPKYQAINRSEIPRVFLDDAKNSYLRIVAGQYADQKGPASTFTPMHLWDIYLHEGNTITLPFCEGDTTLIFLRSGNIMLIDGYLLTEKTLGIFSRTGSTLTLTAKQNSYFVVLSGTPLNEPIVGHGPFVMNTTTEIKQAISDYESGRFNALSESQSN